jgi:signal transduction histidine kinase
VLNGPRNGTIAFTPRARLLKLIGEELISDEVVAVSELVKNAHDADALTVTVRFCGVTGPDGTIEVRDDGTGMDLKTLLGRWMEPAASTKVGRGRQVTRRGRRVLGEKGVGRFAADKLARNLEIITRAMGGRDEAVALIDWDQFDTDSVQLSSVESRWESRSAQEITRHGTVLRMTGLRSVWSERLFRRLAIRLSRLLSPFSERDQFAIHIESDEFPEYSGELRADFLNNAPYRVEAEFDGEQTISLSLNGRRSVSERWNGQGDLSCGPVRIRLFAFDLEGEALARLGPRTEVRAWLREWTGVSIYRDGFRVWPYGEPHDDWLRLDQRRVNNPVERLSNNQVIGFIDIGRDRNPELMDQTNREGLIHNVQFEDLRRLVYFVFHAIEAERQSIRHPQKRVSTAVRELNGKTSSVAGELERLARRVDRDTSKELRALSRRLQEETGKELSRLETLIDGYAGLAAAGQLASSLATVIPAEVGVIQQYLGQIRTELSRKKLPEAREAFGSVDRSLKSLADLQRLIVAASGNGERRRAIDLVSETSSFRDLMSSALASRGIKMEIAYKEHEVLRTEMRPETYYCLLQILTSNSLDWLPAVECPRIRIAICGDGDFCEITFSDNGPGVPSQYCSRIFDPLFTRKECGRGMGLTLARKLVESHRGHLSLLMDGRRRGASFRIVLPRKRSRATVYNGRAH